jgi:hypothetical protein
MADLLSQPTGPELTKAFDYWRLADAALPSLHSRYLSNKAKEIGAKMASRRDVWMVFRQEVLDPTPSGNRFRKLGERLDRWIIDRIEEEPDLTMSERARRLGVTPSGYLQKKRALDDRPRPS